MTYLLTISIEYYRDYYTEYFWILYWVLQYGYSFVIINVDPTFFNENFQFRN